MDNATWNREYAAKQTETAGDTCVEETHGSFGLAKLCRITGGKQSLFGSSLKHSEKISLTISTAERVRHLGRYWYHTLKDVVEFYMSQAQFVELITTMNSGSGVPITLQRICGEDIEGYDHEDERTIAHDEFREEMQNLVSRLDTLEEVTQTLNLKGGLGAREKQKVATQLRGLIQEIRSNIPFYEKCFGDSVSRVMTEAKADFEAFVEHKVRDLGLQAIQETGELTVPELDMKDS